jgi:hydrogenase expression/formation protein HypD
MKFVKEFRDSQVAKKIIEAINAISTKNIQLMEVCGTHTVSIFKHGIRDVLPPSIKLLSGPGCPVCVTSNEVLDEAIALVRLPKVILCTFGDMLKVPGSTSSLAKEKAEGQDIRIVYSTIDALKIAKENPDHEVVFFGIGFETTAPTVAASILAADTQGIKNYSVLGAHKLIPEAMRALLTDQEIKVDGFICPGHVTAIIGVKPYEFIAEEFHVPAVITGFEPVDMLQGIYMLVKQIEAGEAKVEIQYSRSVPQEGNPVALELLYKVFEITDATWRGIGSIPGTGIELRKEYQQYDTRRKLEFTVETLKVNPGCICGNILKGINTPLECKLFGKVCHPQNPIGACMVSTEGTCAAYYKYKTQE